MEDHDCPEVLCISCPRPNDFLRTSGAGQHGRRGRGTGEEGQACGAQGQGPRCTRMHKSLAGASVRGHSACGMWLKLRHEQAALGTRRHAPRRHAHKGEGQCWSQDWWQAAIAAPHSCWGSCCCGNSCGPEQPGGFFGSPAMALSGAPPATAVSNVELAVIDEPGEVLGSSQGSALDGLSDMEIELDLPPGAPIDHAHAEPLPPRASPKPTIVDQDLAGVAGFVGFNFRRPAKARQFLCQGGFPLIPSIHLFVFFN